MRVRHIRGIARWRLRRRSMQLACNRPRKNGCRRKEARRPGLGSNFRSLCARRRSYRICWAPSEMGKCDRVHGYHFYRCYNRSTTVVEPQIILAKFDTYLLPPLPCGHRGRAERAFDKCGPSWPSGDPHSNGRGSPYRFCTVEDIDGTIRFTFSVIVGC